jgi:bifunctional non-homologous end joining protein LigD
MPVRLYLFDELHLDLQPWLQLPYTERRALLDGLKLDDALVTMPPWWPDARC